MHYVWVLRACQVHEIVSGGPGWLQGANVNPSVARLCLPLRRFFTLEYSAPLVLHLRFHWERPIRDTMEKKNLLARDIESEKKKQCKLRAWKVLEIRYLASSLYLLKHAVCYVYIYVHTREDAFSIYLARP